ncbi:MAG TPA: carboxypeptidase-like regulatory domain-containing protein [Methylomirabilota bacterium]|nr:carboxypeptidase-like regulatory domain-containing protein [Methylomirabilota bacterium]
MNQPENSKGGALPLLAAFTLGILAMAAIGIFVLMPFLKPKADGPENSPATEQPLVEEVTEIPPQPAVTRAAAASPPLVTNRTHHAAMAAPIALEPEAERLAEAPGNRAPVDSHIPIALENLAIGGFRLGGGGVIEGVVQFRGVPPPERPIAMGANDPCANLPGAPKTTRFFRIGSEGGLADVLVYLEGIGASNQLARTWPLQAKTLPIVYSGCDVEPYIAAAQVGQVLTIQSLDSGMHNAHVTPDRRSGNRDANYALMPKSQPVELPLKSPEMFMRIKCDVHPWEFGYVSIFEHPFFAVTGPDGAFRMTGVPPGRYVLKAVHRKSGTNETDIAVQGRGGQRVSITFEAGAEVASRQ